MPVTVCASTDKDLVWSIGKLLAWFWSWSLGMSWNVLDLWKRLKRLFEKDVSSAPQTRLSQVAQRKGQSEQPREQVGKRSVICRPVKGGKNCVGNDRLPSLLGKNRQTFNFSLWKNLKVPLTIPLTYLDFPNKIYGWIVLAKAQVRCSEHSQGKIMQVHQSLFSRESTMKV